jgi:hypothetical protein
MLPRVSILILCLAIGATSAFANVTLPISGFNCALQTTPYFGSVTLQDCTSAGAAVAATPPANGLQGVGLGYSGSVSWDVAGSDYVGSQTFGTGSSEYQSNILTLSTNGLTGGSGSTTIYLPLHYDFTITPGTFTCLSSANCTTPEVDWSLSLTLNGAAVSNSDGAFLNIARGSGTGEFTGDVVVPHASNPVITANPMTITAGEGVTVTASLTLTANGILSDEAGSFSVQVPEGATFDFQSAQDVNHPVPEPATFSLMLGAGVAAVLMLAKRRRAHAGAEAGTAR